MYFTRTLVSGPLFSVADKRRYSEAVLCEICCHFVAATWLQTNSTIITQTVCFNQFTDQLSG